MRNAGFTMIEVLIAGALLLLITIGLLPLFTRSVLNNVTGAESTQVSNNAKSQTEAYDNVPFDSPLLAVAPGSTEATATDYRDVSNPGIDTTHLGWSAAAGSGTRWIRTTKVSLLQATNLLNPLDGGTDTSFVHLKAINVKVATKTITGATGSLEVLNQTKGISLTMYRAF